MGSGSRSFVGSGTFGLAEVESWCACRVASRVGKATCIVLSADYVTVSPLLFETAAQSHCLSVCSATSFPNTGRAGRAYGMSSGMLDANAVVPALRTNLQAYHSMQFLMWALFHVPEDVDVRLVDPPCQSVDAPPPFD